MLPNTLKTAIPRKARHLSLFLLCIIAACRVENYQASRSTSQRLHHQAPGPTTAPSDRTLRAHIGVNGDNLTFYLNWSPGVPPDQLRFVAQDGYSSTRPAATAVTVDARALSAEAVSGTWTIDSGTYQPLRIALPYTDAISLIGRLGQDPRTRIGLQNRRGRAYDLDFDKAFDCVNPYTTPLQSHTAWDDPVAVEKALVEYLKTRASERDLNTARKAELEIKRKHLGRSLGPKVFSAMGRVTGRSPTGYFVWGATIPVDSTGDFWRNPGFVADGPMHVSGTDLDVVSGAVLMPTTVVYVGTKKAQNGFGAVMLIDAFSSKLSSAQRRANAELKATEDQLKQLFELSRSAEGDEAVDLLLVDLQRWRLRYCPSINHD